MINHIQTLIALFFITAASVYNVHKLSGRKVEYKNKRVLLYFFALMIFALINYFNFNAYIRIAIITISLAIFYKLLFRSTIKESIITALVSQLIIMISEMFFVFTISLIFGLESQDIVNSQFGSMCSNIGISLISFAIVQIPLLRKFRNFLLKITDKLKNIQLIFFFAIIVIIANILTMILYYSIDFKYLLVFNTFVTLFFLIIILYTLKNKNNYIKVYDKYNTTLNSLKEYEDILDNYRISNHENKNQLLTIRNMIPKTNKKVISYIDQVVENKLKDNEKIMFETAKIPAGGLRGLIYSKILIIKNCGINYELEISKEIKTVDLINIDDALMLDICKVIGVYIDNSIEAVESLKEKHINIEIYLEDKNLVIAISNNFKGSIDVNKIEEKGYTTKDKGHGYGLALVKQIIENNKNLVNEKKLTKDIFTQVLKIKM